MVSEPGARAERLHAVNVQRVAQEGSEHAHGIAAAAHTGAHGVRKQSGHFQELFPGFHADAHLEVAKKIGISPLADREEAEAMKEKLTHITDNEFYAVDSLTHSIPYLVPRASALLDTIGSNFLDSLAAKGLNPNQVIITSVLRTENDVKRLRRRNGNASANSAHCFGATFDVSWKRFKKVEDKDGRPMQDVSADTLKLVLSEVLRDLRQAEKCYIKYELKQGCFHITAR